MLRKLFSSGRSYQPIFDDDNVVKVLATRSSTFDAYRKARASHSSAELLAGFFRQLMPSKFFSDLEQLRACANLARREMPVWVETTLASVSEEIQRGLRIYGRLGPPLGEGFAWTTLEAGPGSDKLYRTRPHRFGFAPRLALAELYGGSSGGILSEVVETWMEVASSRDNHLAYDSNLTVIHRLLALSWTWAFLAAREAMSFEQLEQEAKVLTVICSDIDFLLPRIGNSYANNHLLADYFAGWFIGCVWPELTGEHVIRGRFASLWLRELSRQTLDDGTSFEHSTHYHEYACEMAAAFVILSRRNQHFVPEWTLVRTRRMLEFQANLAGPESMPVAIGDGTEDPLFPLDNGDGWAAATWREIHRSLFGTRLAPASENALSRERAFWLLGGSTARETNGAETSPPLSSYPKGGFYVFSDDYCGSRMVLRAGPTEGEIASPGHAHSDLLSIYWSEFGRPLTVDAGTYTYRSREAGWPLDTPDWRRYLMGPAAHNGLHIRGHDPLGHIGRSFRRGKLETFVSVSRVAHTTAVSWVDARIAGGGPYDSYRRGVVRIQGEYFVIYDILPAGKAALDAEFGFQFSPQVEVEHSGVRGIKAHCGRGTAFIAGSAGLADPVVLVGSLEPLGGWVSPSYGTLVPAPQVRFAAEARAATAFLLGRTSSAENAEISVRRLQERGLRISIFWGNVEDRLLVNLSSVHSEVADEDVDFQGALLWIRCRDGVPSKLRWLGGSRCIWRGKGIFVQSVEPCVNLAVESDASGLCVQLCDSEKVSIAWPG